MLILHNFLRNNFYVIIGLIETIYIKKCIFFFENKDIWDIINIITGNEFHPVYCVNKILYLY